MSHHGTNGNTITFKVSGATEAELLESALEIAVKYFKCEPSELKYAQFDATPTEWVVGSGALVGWEADITVYKKKKTELDINKQV